MDAGEAKQRCRVAIERIERLPHSSNIKRTLLRLANSELNFLSRSSPTPIPISVNITHLEAVLHILQQPSITSVSRVCKPVPFPSIGGHRENEGSLANIHVDIVCTLNRRPVWFIVSDRNPKHISWHEHGSHKSKGLRDRIQLVLEAARSSASLKPSSIILFFSKGLNDVVHNKVKDEFGGSDLRCSEFTDLDFEISKELSSEQANILARSYQEACVMEIKVYHSGNSFVREKCRFNDSCSGVMKLEIAKEKENIQLDGSFYALVSGMRICCRDANAEEESGVLNNLINFDTTALIAIVSGISNGGTGKLLAAPESELRLRFKSNYDFVIGQAMSEIQNPILPELSEATSGKTGFICESVLNEFEEIASMCGGADEKSRAHHLIKQLMIVRDNPSERIKGLPTTRKMALKNKIVFGTGDSWQAPTLTANLAFARAVLQIGVSLFIIEHRPRALIGDW